jgi:hypothetical protein
VNWQYGNFWEQFNAWVDADDPSDEFKFWVMAWLYRIQEDPEADAAPAEDIGRPWWFAVIPGAEDNTRAVVCLYSIGLVQDEVKCSGFSTLRKPIL